MKTVVGVNTRREMKYKMEYGVHKLRMYVRGVSREWKQIRKYFLFLKKQF